MKIEIDENEYEELIRDQKLLCVLEECGVDNWEGYADAVNLASYNLKSYKKRLTSASP